MGRARWCHGRKNRHRRLREAGFRVELGHHLNLEVAVPHTNAKAMRRYDLHRTITFRSRVKRAREFAHSLPEVIAWMPARQHPTGHLWSDYASGEMPAGQRRALPAPRKAQPR